MYKKREEQPDMFRVCAAAQGCLQLQEDGAAGRAQPLHLPAEGGGLCRW